MEEKQQIRLNFQFLDFPGSVQLKNPDIELWLLINYGHLADRNLAVENGVAESSIDYSQIAKPTFFGRKVCDGGMKDELRKYSLKKRVYLGPTSLDDALGMILCNMGLVQKQMFAYEPFIGTGSIAIAMTHFGAMVTGSDIDPRVLRGDMHAGKDLEHITNNAKYYAEKKVQQQQQTEGGDVFKAGLQNIFESTRKPKQQQGAAAAAASSSSSAVSRDVFGNFRVYNLPLPELIRMDHHLLDRHFNFAACPDGFFDVIVTDPPYGIRAGAKKSGRKGGVEYSISEERRYDHIPSTQTYPVEEVMLDLMHTAAKTLTLHGRLVYLLPTPYDFSTQDLPLHPCLTLLDVCHQGLSSRHGRRAVVMAKTSHFTASTEAEFNQYKQRVLAGEDEGFGLLMSKLEAALAADAHENENVVK